MPEDLQWDGTDLVRASDGDLATVSGRQNLEQSLALLVRREVGGLIGETITATTLAETENAIRRAVSADPQFSGIRQLSVTTIDKRNNTITVKAETNEQELTVTV